jgi:hypothetical protein
MDLVKIKNLTSMGAIGQLDIQRAQVGSNGYGFVYFDFSNPLVDPAFRKRSSKVCGAGAHFGDFEKFMGLEELNLERLSDVKGILKDIKHDLLLAGSLKTLLPDLRIGGDERMFSSLMFVLTPEDLFFPATFYFGPSGTALGGWIIKQYQEFPTEISNEFNFSPFDLDKDGLTGLVEAQMFALKKIPVSDLCGIYAHDSGSALMFVLNGVPIVMELGYPKEYDEDDVGLILEGYGYDIEQDKFNYKEIVKRAKR